VGPSGTNEIRTAVRRQGIVVPIQAALSSRSAVTDQLSGPDLSKATEAFFTFSWRAVVSAKTAGLCPLVGHFDGEPVGNTSGGMGLLQSAPVPLKVANQAALAYANTRRNLRRGSCASHTTRTMLAAHTLVLTGIWVTIP
jgi:hypothetical protein